MGLEGVIVLLKGWVRHRAPVHRQTPPQSKWSRRFSCDLRASPERPNLSFPPRTTPLEAASTHCLQIDSLGAAIRLMHPSHRLVEALSARPALSALCA